MSAPIRISEIFGPTIQGEGALIGQPTVFVRTGGCDYQCSWCDTKYAADSAFKNEWIAMSAEEILAKVEELSGGRPLMISLSGGNPAIQPLGELIALGKARGYCFAMETQGSIAKDWFADLDTITFSPKPPSSGMKTDWNAFDECLKAAGNSPDLSLKIVVFDEEDYKYAQTAAQRYPHLPLYLQAGNSTPAPMESDMNALMIRMRWLADKVTEDQWFSAKVLPQLHVMMWGNTRGV
jgi:7-carboxy-7-deazaguanine synthase